MHEVLSDPWQIGTIVFHSLAVVFLALAVTVILKRIFQRQAIRTDEVIGAAVVVAQLVGLKLAQAIQRDRPDA
jgi:hypothetical protein